MVRIVKTASYDFVPMDEYFDEEFLAFKTKITFNDGSSLFGTGSLNWSKYELGLTVPINQGSSNLSLTDLVTTFTTNSKTRKIQFGYSETEYDQVEGFTDLVGVTISEENYYVSMSFPQLVAVDDLEDLDPITTQIQLYDGSNIYGYPVEEARKRTLELVVAEKQSSIARNILWMINRFSNPNYTRSIRYRHSDKSSDTEYSGYITLAKIQKDIEAERYYITLKK